ncbi:MAG TPA: hypothetical protein DD396_05285, partial [Bacteroidetes bacterium]|nr:hypothetical protein [Bacteroidota bacterium]
MNITKVSILLCGVLISTVSSAQKFCEHMRIAEQSAMLYTLDSRTDTFDVLSYEINAAFLDYQLAKNIEANTVLTCILKVPNTGSMRLDLLGLNVTEVLVNGTSTIFSYSSPSIELLLPPLVNDTFKVTVFYNGTPKPDAQWGGFYFTGEYAFNLGVGFAADPHNFGRAWFPCFDNFTDRALYYTNITVDSGFKAYANGYLTEILNNGNATQTFKWTMDEAIPTYLAS